MQVFVMQGYYIIKCSARKSVLFASVLFKIH